MDRGDQTDVPPLTKRTGGGDQMGTRKRKLLKKLPKKGRAHFLEAWLTGPGEAGAVKHRRLSPRHLAALRSARKNYSDEEILTAFHRYAFCLSHPGMWAHRWGMDDLLTVKSGKWLEILLQDDWKKHMEAARPKGWKVERVAKLIRNLGEAAVGRSEQPNLKGKVMPSRVAR